MLIMKGLILSVELLIMMIGTWTHVYFRLLMLAGDLTLLIVLLLSIMHFYLVLTVDSECLAVKVLIRLQPIGVVS